MDNGFEFTYKQGIRTHKLVIRSDEFDEHDFDIFNKWMKGIDESFDMHKLAELTCTDSDSR